MKQETTYWLNRKAFRDSVNYGTICPTSDKLSLGDSVWTRTIDSNTGMALWDTLITTRATSNGMLVEMWDNSGDKPVLASVLEVV